MTIQEDSQSVSLPDKHIKDTDLIDLWKYFQDRADMLKERQWTVGTWVLALVSGLIAFTLNQETLSITRVGITITKPVPIIAIGVVGILLCIYGWIVVYSYGKHIQRNWSRSDRVKEKIIPLSYILKGEFENQSSNAEESADSPRRSLGLPRESRYLIIILMGYFLIFIGMVFAGFLSSILLVVNTISQFR